MLFDGWNGPLRILVTAVLTYPILILFLRISGKRTLAKMNAFDLVITVALGSTLASAITSDRMSVTEAAVALGALIALQFVVAWSAVRFPAVARLVKSDPRVLVREGEVVEAALRTERLTEEEVRAAARAAGHDDLAAVRLMTLETDGGVSVAPLGATALRESA